MKKYEQWTFKQDGSASCGLPGRRQSPRLEAGSQNSCVENDYTSIVYKKTLALCTSCVDIQRNHLHMNMDRCHLFGASVRRTPIYKPAELVSVGRNLIFPLLCKRDLSSLRLSLDDPAAAKPRSRRPALRCFLCKRGDSCPPSSVQLGATCEGSDGISHARAVGAKTSEHLHPAGSCPVGHMKEI